MYLCHIRFKKLGPISLMGLSATQCAGRQLHGYIGKSLEKGYIGHVLRCPKYLKEKRQKCNIFVIRDSASVAKSQHAHPHCTR